jgi:hypothetical protein
MKNINKVELVKKSKGSPGDFNVDLIAPGINQYHGSHTSYIDSTEQKPRMGTSDA